MPLASTLCAERCAADSSWWLAAPALLRDIQQQSPAPQASARYRLGDSVFEIAVDDPVLLEKFRQMYGDCAVSAPIAPDMPRVRCTVRRGGDPQLILLTFETGAPPDPAGAAFNLLRPTRAVPPFSVHDSRIAGWRLAGGAVEPVLAACGPYVLIAPWQVPADFLVEYLVGITLAAQPELLAVHGASLQMRDAGMVIVGGSHAGKTTTALHLAARGHTLFGDELALIRLASREIVPFRRTLNLRPGPRAPELAAVLERAGDREKLAVDDEWVGPHWIGDLFPGSSPCPASLQAVFFLDGFANRASLAPFRLTLHDTDVVNWLAQPAIAYCSWGLAPERRALRLLALRQLLARVPCWRLKVGPPAETAQLIERTMEEQCY